MNQPKKIPDKNMNMWQLKRSVYNDEMVIYNVFF